MSDAESALAQMEVLLARPTPERLEEAAALAEALAGERPDLFSERARRSLGLCLRLAEQARDHYRTVTELVELRRGGYTAGGTARVAESHALTVEG